MIKPGIKFVMFGRKSKLIIANKVFSISTKYEYMIKNEVEDD